METCNRKYWMARFYDLTGKPRNQSTKTEDRKEARKLAAAYEEAARRKRTALQCCGVIADLHMEITGERVPEATVREFFKCQALRAAGPRDGQRANFDRTPKD
jgi:hypothetical protein